MNVEMREALAFVSDFTVNGTWDITWQISTGKDFRNQLRSFVVGNSKAEIYEKFGVRVNVPGDAEECWIPEDVLYRMNDDAALREKVYAMLADYASPKFQRTKAALYPPVKKCTLVFDEKGNVVTTLEPDMEKLEEEADSSHKKKGRLTGWLASEMYGLGIMNSVEVYNPFQSMDLQRALLTSALIRPKVLRE